jgi:hypothetical protein
MTTYYPLIGGLMLGSCVYHHLYYNGSVLGISGIYRSSLSAISAKLRKNILYSDKPSKGPSISDRDNIDEEPENQSAVDTSANDSSQGDQNWKIAFTAGLLGGGALLRVFRPQIEKQLGITLFDPVSVRLLSKYPLATFLAGMLIGVGTKVTKPLNVIDHIDGPRMYIRTHAMWDIPLIITFHNSDSNLLRNRCGGSPPSPTNYTTASSIISNTQIRSHHDPYSSTSTTPLPIHYTQHNP